jgi:hypothetical protein
MQLIRMPLAVTFAGLLVTGACTPPASVASSSASPSTPPSAAAAPSPLPSPAASPSPIAFPSPSPASGGTPVAKRVLAPATVLAVVGLCSTQVQQYQNGNAGPLLCRDGEVVVEAWNYFAAADPHVLSLGRSSTSKEVEAAICADKNVNHATNPMEISGYVLAAAYYGWHFAPEPWQVMYNPPYCA